MSVISIEDRDWLSTTEAAAILELSHMTVIRRFDAGDLKGYRVPGSRFRRIPKNSLRKFAELHGLPLKGLDSTNATESPQPARKQRVLVVDDDQHLVMVIQKVLLTDGWEVKVATNGFDAGFAAIRFQPDLVLLDIMLPGMDGRDAARQIRSDPQLVHTRILAITALRDDRCIKEMFEAGVDDYLPKPFTMETLREKVSEMMNHKVLRLVMAG